MQLFDLSHPISSKMPVYPGTEPPSIVTSHTIDTNGYLERKVTFYTHTGTHIDAPSHLLKEGRALDSFSIDAFFGKAFLIDLSSNPSPTIHTTSLEIYRDSIAESDFVLINSGWSTFWGTQDYFSHYPVLSDNAARWLSGFELKGVGFDTISVDKPDSTDFPIHNILLKRKWIIIENLTNLSSIPCNRFLFSCFPLAIESADGSPVRAAAIVM